MASERVRELNSRESEGMNSARDVGRVGELGRHGPAEKAQAGEPLGLQVGYRTGYEPVVRVVEGWHDGLGNFPDRQRAVRLGRKGGCLRQTFRRELPGCLGDIQSDPADQ